MSEGQDKDEREERELERVCNNGRRRKLKKQGREDDKSE